MRDTLDNFEHDAATLVRLFNTPICTLTMDQIRDHLDEIQECTLRIEEYMVAMRYHNYQILGAIDKHES